MKKRPPKYSILITTLLLLFFSACTKKDTPKAEPVFLTPSMQETEVINDKGIDQWAAGNYPTALEYFTEAYTIAKKNKDTYMIATLLNNMGLVNWRMNHNNEAMECYTESAKI